MKRTKLPVHHAKGPGRSRYTSRWHAPVLSTIAASVLALTSLDAQALALGRLAVQSVLGEPLRAEIDIPQINAEEAASLRVGVAPASAFAAAGFEFNPVVSTVQVSLQRRADGRHYLRLTGDRAINDPFVDLVIEANWISGRIVRDYTMLLDPPSLRQPAPQVLPPQATPAPLPQTRAPAPVATPPAAAQPPATPRAAPPTPAPRPPAAPVAAAQPSSQQLTVRAGDTAGRIAAANKPANVSLDQMLVAMMQANPDAFVGGNVNRLRAGAVLDLPSAEQAAAVTADQARQTIVAQSRDFSEFRRRLAENAPAAQVAAPDRQASGQVQANVDDRRPGATAPDRLTLSRGAATGAPAAPGTEDRIAQTRQAQDTSTRVAELSRNLDELAKLQSAASAPAATTAAPAPASAASVPAAATLPAPAGVTAPTPDAAASAPQVAASEAVAAAPAPAPAPAPRPAPPPPPPPEPSFLESLLENPLIPGAAAALILLLLGYGGYRYRQGRRAAQVDSSFLESRLQPDSFFGASGGQRVDTNEAAPSASSMVYSPSQLDAAGDVDPVAEADVYLAYGRDLQAEEILKEALRASPQRVAIHVKLMEIYAKRRDAKAFEAVAVEAYRLTSGSGDDWAKACELGREIDPDNTLYQPGGEPGANAAAATTAFLAGAAAATVPQAAQPDIAANPAVDLDLDLDFSASQTAANPARVPSMPMDEPTVAVPSLPDSAPAPLEMDFNLDTTAVRPLSNTEPAPLSLELPPAGGPAEPSLPSAASAPTASPAAVDSGLIEFDLGSLSLDLGSDGSGGAANTSMAPLPDLNGGDADSPLATKLALAEEFRAIGDADGARALIEEVVAEATGDLKARAQKQLADLG
ncbi:MAG: fimbrial protein FimV [Burkholderiales bacterium]|nr:fimbrial protein FimV [Burkholderiales bacterium]